MKSILLIMVLVAILGFGYYYIFYKPSEEKNEIRAIKEECYQKASLYNPGASGLNTLGDPKSGYYYSCLASKGVQDK